MQAGHSPRRRKLPALVASILAVIGVTLITVASCSSRPGAPQPSATNAGTLDGTTSSASAPSSVTSQTPAPASSSAELTPAASAAESTEPVPAPSASAPLTLPAAKPISLSIPSIKVNSSVDDLGLNTDGSIEVPPLTDPNSKAGWYDQSPAPGALGPSILLGHVDSAKYGPGVFYNLGKLNPGDTIEITRDDNTVAVFAVDGVRSYAKDQFPTLEVYGNLDHAGLRLITCGGTFNPASGHYESNTIAFASLVSSGPA